MFNPIYIQKLSYKLRVKRIPFIPKIITIFIRLVFCCYFPSSVKIGKNFKIGYGGLGVVIHDRVVIGDNCHIDQCVTIGGTSKKYEVPVIGNDVYFGSGCKVIGPITIGNNVVIGANAVVINNIPDNSLVVGVPGKVIKKNIYKVDYV